MTKSIYNIRYWKFEIKKVFLFIFLFLCIGSTYIFAGDLLDKAFQPSIEQEGLINLGKTKDQVGNEILRESTNVNISLQNGISTSQRAPLIVRIAKLLLRLTIVLSVSMVLYNGVLYIIQSSKGESPKEPQKNLLNIGIGILLALSSLGIINLLNSISISSLKTSEDMGFNDKFNSRYKISIEFILNKKNSFNFYKSISNKNEIL